LRLLDGVAVRDPAGVTVALLVEVAPPPPFLAGAGTPIRAMAAAAALADDVVEFAAKIDEEAEGLVTEGGEGRGGPPATADDDDAPLPATDLADDEANEDAEGDPPAPAPPPKFSRPANGSAGSNAVWGGRALRGGGPAIIR
jgi:hypothetical protein